MRPLFKLKRHIDRYLFLYLIPVPIGLGILIAEIILHVFFNNRLNL